MCAWDHASETVKQQIEQLNGFSNHRLACYETNLRQRLSLADVIAVDRAFGVGFATKFVADVDLWIYPDEQTKATIGVKAYVQSNLDKSRALNGTFEKFTEESKTSHLLSPFLLKPKLRPALVRKSQAKNAPAPAQTATHVVLGILPAHILPSLKVLEGNVPHALFLHKTSETPPPPPPPPLLPPCRYA